jgi:hypothetical protein
LVSYISPILNAQLLCKTFTSKLSELALCSRSEGPLSALCVDRRERP